MNDWNNFIENFDSLNNIQLDYSILPNLVITLRDTTGENLKLVMTARDYIQGDGSGHIKFLVQKNADHKVTLGAPVFDTFYIVLDRANKRVGFGPGCDCVKN